MRSKKNFIHALLGIMLLLPFAACTKSVIEKTNSLPVDGNINVSGARAESLGDSTYTVQPTEWMVDGTNLPPGSTLYIAAGNRGALLLKNIKGTAAKPIVIINQGGKVTFTAPVTASYGFKTQNCRYFKILGNGDPDVDYGFDVNGGNIGITMDDLSSDFEIAYVEVRNTGFAGIMAKTDPSCDPATWRGHFVMKNVAIHHNYVHKTGGEGMYIGNSFYADGLSTSCGTVLPHDVLNLKVYRNITDSTGCEGIQVGSAVSGCEIYKNQVKNPGASPFAAFQNNGIQLGEGTGGKCYNNLVKDAPGNGIIVLGLGDNQVFNNIILNSKGYGIFADSRFTPGLNFQFINNTIIASALGGIKLNSESIPMNTVINNAFIQTGTIPSIIRKSTDVRLLASNNYVGDDVSDCQFVNYKWGDFHLLPTSPLIDKGVNAFLYGVKTDYYSAVRPLIDAFDIGASQY